MNSSQANLLVQKRRCQYTTICEQCKFKIETKLFDCYHPGERVSNLPSEQLLDPSAAEEKQSKSVRGFYEVH
jgi:hypothetical protein